jgi:hypothetical protein
MWCPNGLCSPASRFLLLALLCCVLAVGARAQCIWVGEGACFVPSCFSFCEVRVLVSSHLVYAVRVRSQATKSGFASRRSLMLRMIRFRGSHNTLKTSKRSNKRHYLLRAVAQEERERHKSSQEKL